MSEQPQRDTDDDFFSQPATDFQFSVQIRFAFDRFKFLPPTTAMSELAEAGVLVRHYDVIRLGAAIGTFHAFPSLHFGKEAIRRERRIAELSAELIDILSPEVRGRDGEDGWRLYWGSADWSQFDETLEPPEPDEQLNVADFCKDLETLAKTAGEQREWLASAKDSEFEPQSNRAERVRYFYWLLLIAFWKFQLQRDVTTCTAPDRQAYGPLVKFIQVMSAGGMSRAETGGDMIRAFIRRFEDRAAHFEEYFSPYLAPNQ